MSTMIAMPAFGVLAPILAVAGILSGVVREEPVAWTATVTAVIVAGKQSQFLPGVRRILHSVNPRPPQRNLPVERALVSASFSAVETRPARARGSFSTIFDLAVHALRRTDSIPISP